MVMPHSALQTGQYSKWRSGKWQARRGGSGLTADFSFKTAWDLERLQPNTFFPVPASVVFARRVAAWPIRPARWPGPWSVGKARQEPTTCARASRCHYRHFGVYRGCLPMPSYSRQGAIIVTRAACSSLTEIENPAVVHASQTVTVNSSGGEAQDKEPWRKSLDLTAITGQTVEVRSPLRRATLGKPSMPYADPATL